MKPDLSQLRDIHLPPPISWWPPAPGWWIAAALLLILAGTGYGWRRWQRNNRWRRQALAQLIHLRGLDASLLAAHLSQLLRRVAISRYPQAEVASLTGEAWLAFLDRTLGDEGTPFQKGAGRALLIGPYAASAEFDSTALLALCEQWIRRQPGGMK